jgi:hypothetical protein
MTELEAVNEMLEAIREGHVAATSATKSSRLAVDILAREKARMLAEGWHCNTDDEVTLTPTAGEIAIAADMLAVDASGEDVRRDLCIRSGKLYDREENTHTFSGPVVCRVIRNLDLEDLIPELQTAIVAKAKTIFHRRCRGGSEDDAMLNQEAFDALFAAKKADADYSNANMLDGTFAAQITGRPGVYLPTR